MSFPCKITRTEQFLELCADYYFDKVNILQISTMILVHKDFAMESLQVVKVLDFIEDSKIFMQL